MERLILTLFLYLVSAITIEETSALPTKSINERYIEKKEIDQKTLDLVEKQMLALLGMKSKTVPRDHLHVPDYMRQVLQKWNGEAHDDTDPMTNVVRAMHHVDNHLLHGKESMIFNMKNLPKTEYVRKAELHMFREGKHNAKKPKAVLHAHSKHTPSSAEKKIKIESRLLNMSSHGWEKFDVTSVIQTWIKEPSEKSKFSIELLEDGESFQPLLHVNKLSSEMSPFDWEKKRPILIIESNEGNKSRKRRAVSQPRIHRETNRHSSKHRARKLHEKAKLKMCRKRNFYLDFHKIGWSKQIISPVGFAMYFCQGTCPKPLGPHMNTTNHAVIQNQVNSFDPTLVPPPCCVPSSLGDRSFLYIDTDSQIVMKTYSDIVVDGCGCR